MRKYILITALILSTSATAHAGFRGLSGPQSNAVEAPATYQVQSSTVAAPATQESVATQPAAQQPVAQPSAADQQAQQQAARQQAMRQKQMMMQQRKMKQARMQQMKQQQMMNMSVGQAVGYKMHQVKTKMKMSLVRALMS